MHLLLRRPGTLWRIGTDDGPQTAMEVIEALIVQATTGARLVVGFMGGEPLLNRALIHEIVPYASRRAREHGSSVSFSITTNGTLITDADARLFCEYPFAVTVSIDGAAADHDSERRLKPAGSAHALLLEGLDRLLRAGRPQLLAARATVTRGSRNLSDRMGHIMALGFDEVGFSPVRASPRPKQEIGGDLDEFVDEMIACSEFALAEIFAGRFYAFSNLETALVQIHRGVRRPLPCGAGAGYLSADADGNYYSCHRLIGDPRHALGSIVNGIDRERQATHLHDKHVDRQEPCRSCWARYLCGGGCYHEVERRGRTGCDAIRRWIEYCLARYVELSAAMPSYFTPRTPAK